MVMFYLLCLYMSSSLIVATIECRGICCINIYRLLYFILKYSSYFMSYTLHCIFFHFQERNSILMVRSSNWRNRRTTTLERQMKKEREKRICLAMHLEAISCIRHTHRDWWSSIENSWTHLQCFGKTMIMFWNDETIFHV